MAQCFVVDLMPFDLQLANQLLDLNQVPGYNGVLQNRENKGMRLVADSRPRSTPSLPKHRNRGEIMGCIALVQFAAPILRR